MTQATEESDINLNRLLYFLKSAQASIERLRLGSEATSALAELVERVELRRDGIRLLLNLPFSTEKSEGTASSRIALTKFIPMQIKRRGNEMKMVLQDKSGPSRIDLPLLKAVARARKWSDDLISGRVRFVGELARREGIDGRSVRRLIRLGFLSPRIVEAIAEGRQPPDLTVNSLTRRVDLLLLWSAQEQALNLR